MKSKPPKPTYPRKKPDRRRTEFVAMLSGSPLKLRGLKGFAEALSATGGGPKVVDQLAIRAACNRMAAADPCPEGPVLIDAVREGRKTVGHRVADAESILRIAHGVARRQTMTAIVRGPLVPKVAKRSGLRDAKPRAWHRDPEESLRRAELVDRFFKAFRPMQMDGLPGDGWAHAIVVPHPPKVAGQKPGADCLVAVDGGASDVAVVHLDENECPLGDGLDRSVLVRTAIAKALSGRDPGKDPSWDAAWRREPAMDPVYAAQVLIAAGKAVDVKWPSAVEYGFWRRLDISWTKVLATGMAHFRKRLPEDVQAHAALCVDQFADMRAAGRFFAVRRGWSLEDYRRCNQAIRTIPMIRDMLLHPAVTAAVHAGRPLEEVVRTAAVSDVAKLFVDDGSPLHPKTVKSLQNTWNLVSKRAGHRSLAELVPVVDAVFRANPHRKVFLAKEMGILVQLCRLDVVETPYLVSAVLAHQDEKGRVSRSGDFHDAYHWLITRCGLVLHGTPYLMEGLRPSAARAAFDICFPGGRGLAGVMALSKEWHAEQARLNFAYDQLFETLMAARMKETDIHRKVDLFPHFLDQDIVLEGVTMWPLADPAAIAAEGTEMGHCVGNYVNAAAKGTSILVAQKSEHGRTTAELKVHTELSETGKELISLRAVQNKSYANEDPPPEHVSAIARLVKTVAPVFLDSLAAQVRIAAMVADRQGLLAYAALPAGDIAQLQDHAFASLQRFMPKRLRKLSRREWAMRYPRIDAEVDGPGFL